MLDRMRGLLVREGAALTGDLTEPRLGPERSRQQYPIAGVLGAEARVSFGSDRQVNDAAALAAYTSGTAWQCFDDIAGRLVEGAPADLVALGADLTRVFDHEIADVPVLSTWLRGERTTP